MVFLTQTESFVSLNVWTSIFTLVNLLLVIYFMKKFLFKPVKEMIDQRQQEIDELYADANADKAEAAALKTSYASRLAEANAESEEILKQAHRKARQREEEILFEAQEKAAQTLRRADEQIALEKKRAMNDLKDEVSGMAVDIASAVLARDIQGKEHAQLIDSFIEKLGDSHD